MGTSPSLKSNGHLSAKQVARRAAPQGASLLSDVVWLEVGRSLNLSARELEIMRGVFDNLTEGAIAARLGISEHRFVYDGWNLVAVLNSSLNMQQSFMWGLDLSGTLQGAGGVGGLAGQLAGTDYVFEIPGRDPQSTVHDQRD